MHNMREAFDHHQSRNFNRTKLRDPSKVVPSQIHEHDVLSPFLLIGCQLLGELNVLRLTLATRVGPGDWSVFEQPARTSHEHLRRCTKKRLIVSEFQKEHVWRR